MCAASTWRRTEGEPDWISESWEHVLWSAGKMVAMGSEGWMCWGGSRSAKLGDGLAKREREKEKETSKTSLMVCKIGLVMIPFLAIKNVKYLLWPKHSTQLLC